MSSPPSQSIESGRARLPSVGDSIHGYEILKEIGQGGMGRVYLAQKQGQRYAIKVLHHASKDARRRFEREIQSLLKVDRHPHIIRVHESFDFESWPCFSMDWVEGQNLDDWLKQQPAPLPPEQALAMLAVIAKTVHFVHLSGVLHRDLKGSNILIRSTDQALFLMDFGLAHVAELETITRSQETLGTPHFMAPEQIDAGQEIGPAADVWALGVLLFQLLTRSYPFEDASAVGLVRKILMEQPPYEQHPGLNKQAQLILKKALAKDPQRRYASAKDLAEDCERVLKGQSLSHEHWRQLQSQSLLRRLTPLLVLLLLGLGLGLFWAWPSESKQAAKLWKMQLIAEGQSLTQALKKEELLLPETVTALLLDRDGYPNPVSERHRARSERCLKELDHFLEKTLKPLTETQRAISAELLNRQRRQFLQSWQQLLRSLLRPKDQPQGSRNLKRLSFGPMIRALQALAEERPEELREAFLESSRSSLFQLMACLGAMRQRQWRQAQTHWQQFEPPAGFDKACEALSADILRGVALQALFAESLNSTRCFKALSQYAKHHQSAKEGEPWRELNEGIQSRFKTLAAPKRQAALILALQRLQKTFAGLKAPTPSTEACRLLADEAAREGRHNDALVIYFKLKKAKPEAVIPEQYSVTEISPLLLKYYYSRKLMKIVDLIVKFAHEGRLVRIPDNITDILQQKRSYQNWQRRNGSNDLVNVLRLLNDFEHFRRASKTIVKFLKTKTREFDAEMPRLKSYPMAVRCKVLSQSAWAHIVLEEQTRQSIKPKLRAELAERLERALKLDPTEPDVIHKLLFLCLEPGHRDRGRHLDEAERWAKHRNWAMRQGLLHKDRALERPLEPIFERDLNQTLSFVDAGRAELLLAGSASQLKEALKYALRSYKRMPGASNTYILLSVYLKRKQLSEARGLLKRHPAFRAFEPYKDLIRQFPELFKD